ncbi:hypothetical protein CK203_022962 [Vitis vinifera]|uniref:Uncharacterized protein n=1 Tax=Vitis vinifera TaxID=29760 RepID=A0A438J496_VITVI|nr:hypothetical protein CK203_022962 [Vitis vinifera]
MARTRGALSALSSSRTLRQRASSARVPRDSPSQAMEALQIPPFEDGVPTSPSSPTPQRRYETKDHLLHQGRLLQALRVQCGALLPKGSGLQA